MSGNTPRKETRKIIKALKRQGFEVVAHNKHIKVRHEDGRWTTIPLTTGDWRSHKNMLADLKRMGVDI